MKTGFRLMLALSIASLLLFSSLPSETSAIPYKIEGYLRDDTGAPISMANVSVTGMTYDPGVQDYVPTTVYVITDAAGYYKVYVAAMEPGGFDDGSDLTVTYATSAGSATSIVEVGGLGAWANLTYKEESNVIDTFISPLGIISIVVIVTVVFLAVYIITHSKKEKAEDESEGKPPKRVERRRR